MNHDDANAILNKFQGWEPGRKCELKTGRYEFRSLASLNSVAVELATHWHCQCGADINLSEFTTPLLGPTAPHDIPPFDYFADTPEAREALRLVKNEFVRLGGRKVERVTELNKEGKLHHGAETIDYGPIWDVDEDHALALALAAAIKGNRK